MTHQPRPVLSGGQGCTILDKVLKPITTRSYYIHVAINESELSFTELIQGLAT